MGSATRSRSRALISSVPLGFLASPDADLRRPSRFSDATRGYVACLVALAVVPLALWVDRSDFPIAPSEIIVLVIASLLLSLRWMLITIGVAVACLALVFVVGDTSDIMSSPRLVSPGSLLAVLAVSTVALVGAFRRQALGLGNVRAESVIEKLRSQLRVQGAVPDLPPGWHVDVEQRAAHGAAIAGDFISSRVHVVDGHPYLDLVVVDVSGKGIDAGTRALLLSGAMGGLLGAVGPDEFLAEANNYLNRQAWPEGFASAVYVRVNLSDGLYSVRSAGHPPALHLDSCAGAWRISTSKGILLGIVPEIAVRPDYRTMGSGDALLLYTDGVVEDPKRDLSWGTERLMAAAGALVRDGATDKVARRLVEQVPTRMDDDRAVVMIWRD